ncbi:MAG: SufE family protein [Myxococcota bacterium]
MDAAELETRLTFFDDWTDRYQYIIALGRKLPELEEAYKTDTYKVRGCMSQVWLKSEIIDGETPTIEFRGDSDSAIVKGLIAILHICLSGRTPRAILDEDLEGLFQRIGLEQHLSPNRRNGFFSMVEELTRSAAVADAR